MLLRVIAHQIACFASDRRALTVFCVTSVHFYAAFLLFAGRESGSGGPGGPRRPRVPRPAPPRQAPALTHTPPTGASARHGDRSPSAQGLFSMLFSYSFHERAEGSRPHFVRPYSLMYSLLILHHSSSRHTQSNTDTTSTAPLAPSYYAPPSTITVHRFLRLRGRGCIRRNLCIREGVRIHTRCVYAPRARVNAPTCVYAPRCGNAPAAYTHPPPRTSTYA